MPDNPGSDRVVAFCDAIVAVSATFGWRASRRTSSCPA
jgi:hypothetical protein